MLLQYMARNVPFLISHWFYLSKLTSFQLLYALSALLHTAFLLSFLHISEMYNPNKTSYYPGMFTDAIMIVLLTMWYVIWIMICPVRHQYYVTERQMTYPIVVILQWIPTALEIPINTTYPWIVNLIINVIFLTRIISLLPLIGRKHWYYFTLQLQLIWLSISTIILFSIMHTVIQ